MSINKKDNKCNEFDFKKFDIIILNEKFDIIIKVFVNIIVDVNYNIKRLSMLI